MHSFNDKKITVVLLDDHPMIRYSFEVAAAKESDINMAATFGHSRELLSWLRVNHADVLMLDYILNSDEMDGLSLIKQIQAHHPDLKILLSSSMESLAVIRAAFMVGIKGYITKREETSHYFDAVRTVAAGQRYVPQNVAIELSQVPTRKRDNSVLEMAFMPDLGEMDMEKLSKLLTPREAEVIRCFLDGLAIVDIASKLKRSRKTISGHKQSGMKKLGISSDLELFKYRSDLFK